MPGYDARNSIRSLRNLVAGARMYREEVVLGCHEPVANRDSNASIWKRLAKGQKDRVDNDLEEAMKPMMADMMKSAPAKKCQLARPLVRLP